MTDFAQIAQQAELFINQHAPSSVMDKAVPAALGIMILGVAVSVLGAKLARFLVTGAFVVAGGIVGLRFGHLVEAAPPLFAMVGSAIIGTIGYLTFRIWVGTMAAIVVGAISLGVFSNQKVLPHLNDFQNQIAIAPQSADADIVIPSREEQSVNQSSGLDQSLRNFWAFANSRDPRVQRQAEAVALASLAAGLLFGLLATRATLIFSTSLFGTSCLAFALVALLGRFSEESKAAMLRSPKLAVIAFGSFLITSLVLQTLLTRKAGAPDDTGPPKS